MEYPKIALKSDGTEETGDKIIGKLISLGGINKDGYRAYSNLNYYFITYEGIIDYEYILPRGYKLVTLEQKQKLFKLI